MGREKNGKISWDVGKIRNLGKSAGRQFPGPSEPYFAEDKSFVKLDTTSIISFKVLFLALNRTRTALIYLWKYW